MEARTARPSTPVIAGLIGGALLVLGSFLTWASMSVNVGALAELLGIDEATLQGAIPGETSQTLSGMTSPADGIWTLIAGLVVLGSAFIVLTRPAMGSAAGVAMVVAGVVGVGWAVYDFTQINDVREEAFGQFAAALQGAGVDVGSGEGLIDVSPGIGLWLALAGGVVALVAGVMVLMGARSPAGASSAGAVSTPRGSETDDLGFGTPAAPAPAAPMPEAGGSTMPEAAAPATEAPPPPPVDPAPTEGGGTDPA